MGIGCSRTTTPSIQVSTLVAFLNSMVFIGGKPHRSHQIYPIENCWGSLKKYSYKPTNLEELMNGIEEFWQTLTPNVCKKDTSHLQRSCQKSWRLMATLADTNSTLTCLIDFQCSFELCNCFLYFLFFHFQSS